MSRTPGIGWGLRGGEPGGPGGVLVFDETGQEKSGVMTAGVGRQYTGTAGRSRMRSWRCTARTPPARPLSD